ncbi:TlpA family protein disulfide reductase [Sphingobacterium lumbrici]|uniref:TlpA family protein disulfide reductase n=1 Tax=Sphingobacterium lumbrici TaxID=2559600 RepID=UPI00112D735E|nr:hypothetical protein [Sphingobacterium lumbrici]
MKITIIFSLLVIPFLTLAQQRLNPDTKENKIDIEHISNVWNYQGQRIDGRTLQGKSIILDFGSIYCAPCVASIRKLDKIAEKHADIVVLFVTKDKYDRIDGFFSKNSNLLKNAYVVFEDTSLNKLFPHVFEPHVAWLNAEHVLKYITNSDVISESSIASFIAGEPLEMGSKSDFIHDAEREMLVWYKELKGMQTQSFRYRYALLGKHIEGVAWKQFQRVDSVSRNVRWGGVNVPILTIYLTTLNKKNLMMTQIITDGVDASDLHYIEQDIPKSIWETKHTYCYEFRDTWPIDEKQWHLYVKDNLDNFFKFRTDFVYKNRECWILKCKSEINKAVKQNKEVLGFNDAFWGWIGTKNNKIGGTPVIIDDNISSLDLKKLECRLDQEASLETVNKYLEPHNLFFEVQDIIIETLTFKSLD